MTPLEGIAHQIACEARIAANCAMDGWAYSISVPASLFSGEVEKTEPIRSYPTRSTIAGELVRIDLNLPHIEPHHASLAFLVSVELEPFIIGVGKIIAQKTAEGIVLHCVDKRQEVGLAHDLLPPKRCKNSAEGAPNLTSDCRISASAGRPAPSV